MSGSSAPNDAPGDDATDDEALADAWATETDEAAAGESGDTGVAAQPARVLNQAEIDSLLGFDNGPSDDDGRDGMQRIISSGLVSYERLPMLEIVFDRLVRIMSTSLRNFTSDNVEVGIDNIMSLRFGDMGLLYNTIKHCHISGLPGNWLAVIQA